MILKSECLFYFCFIFIICLFFYFSIFCSVWFCMLCLCRRLAKSSCPFTGLYLLYMHAGYHYKAPVLREIGLTDMKMHAYSVQFVCFYLYCFIHSCFDLLFLFLTVASIIYYFKQYCKNHQILMNYIITV